jgi:opacity protein-like surface antigen
MKMLLTAALALTALTGVAQAAPRDQEQENFVTAFAETVQTSLLAGVVAKCDPANLVEAKATVAALHAGQRTTEFDAQAKESTARDMAKPDFCAQFGKYLNIVSKNLREHPEFVSGLENRKRLFGLNP